MAAYTQTFIDSPPESQDHGRGGERIRETRNETRKRFAPEHDVGDSSVEAGYTDTGRHSPGSARAYYGKTQPTTLWKPDGTALTSIPAGSVNLGDSDRGRLWFDEGGGRHILRTFDPTFTTDRFQGIYGVENRFINGSLLIWQRGTTFSVTTGSTTWTADRWFVQPTGATATVTRQTNALSDQRSAFMVRMAGAVGMTNLRLGYRFRAADVHPIIRNNGASFMTFSMTWHNDTAGAVNPTFEISEANATDNFSAVTNRSGPTAVGSVAAGATGVAVITISMDAITIANGFQVRWDFGAITAGNIEVSELLAEAGSEPSVFYQRPFDVELADCLPYYEKTFSYATAPAQNAGLPGAAIALGAGGNAAAQDFCYHWHFAAPKVKATYTVTGFNPLNASADFRNLVDSSNVGTGMNTTISAIDSRGTSGCTVVNAAGIAGSQQEALAIHLTADAELT